MAGHPASLDALVERTLDGARTPALVVTDLPLGPLGADPAEVSVQPVGASAEGFRTVVLVVDDVVELRRAVSALGGPGALGQARTIGCVVAHAEAAVVPRVHPVWPALEDLDARLVDGAAVTLLQLGARTHVARVLMGIALGAAPPVTPGPGGLWVAGDVVPPADPLYVREYDPEAELPPDVVVGVSGPLAESPVTGRAPSACPSLPAPLDEAVYNPRGFRRTWSRGRVDLAPGTRPSPVLVADLRDAHWVALPDAATPDLVAALAVSGVPTAPIDDPAERERASVRTRRAALLEHSSVAWRQRLAQEAGVRHDPLRAGVVTSPGLDEDDVTDLLLARRYSGADLVVLPAAADGPTECFVATPPPGAVAHRADTTPAQVLAAGGLVYVTRPRGRG